MKKCPGEVQAMPYFVQIGLIPENKTGVGSRGYHVYRRGTRVRVIWGLWEQFADAR